MGDIDTLRSEMEAARAELLAAIEGVTQEEFERRPPESADDEERWSMRQALWHVGLIEDWFRRVISKAMSGQPIDAFHWREPPAIAQTPAYLVEWLDQCRRPTLALMRRIPEERLDEEFTLLEGEVRTARRLLAHLARHDRQHVEHIRTLKGAAAGLTGSMSEAIDRLREDIEFSATIRGQALRFRSTWGTFSPREVDAGTLMLIDAIEVAADADCFDLGCGYGPIGLTLARLAPDGQTLMVDRDYVAVAYANRNAELNNITNARAILSNGFSEVPAGQQFDVVATNLPAKVGNEMTSILFADAAAHLRPGGRLYAVTLSGMRKYIQRTLEETFGTYEKVHQGRQHTVHMAVRNLP